MRILSIDVGIKNLAFCLFDDQQNVLKWDIIDLTKKESLPENIPMCCGFDKKKCACKFPAKFAAVDGSEYCAKHAKADTNFKIPPKKDLSKFKHKELIDLAIESSLTFSSPIKKVDLISLLNGVFYKKIEIENVNASKLDIVTIGKNIKSNFDEILKEKIDCVIIENQISPIANRMKTIQGMIAQYFIMKNPEICIEFISSINKLKDCEVKSNSYAERKKIGIQYCLELLEKNGHAALWLEYFKTHKKKDDLSDAYLQGIWFLNKK
jgi:hypothetical protein